MKRQRPELANDTTEQMCRRNSLNKGKSEWLWGKNSVTYSAAKEIDSLSNDLKVSLVWDGIEP